MATKQILWDIFTRTLPVVIVYLWKKWDTAKKIKKIQISKEQYESKISFYPQIMMLKKESVIKGAVDRIFEQTRATRFLILCGANGKAATAHVSVIFDRLKDEDVTTRPKHIYRNIKTDAVYKNMLVKIKSVGQIIIDVLEMPRGMLKSIYYKEIVRHSIVSYFFTTPIDKDNNAFIYSSIATDEEESFSDYEMAIINQELDIIKHLLQ